MNTYPPNDNLIGMINYYLANIDQMKTSLSKQICCHIIIIMILLFCTAKAPTLPVLQNFKTNDGRTLNVLTRIGSKYENFGTCLLNDNDGGKMDTIDDHRNAETKLNSVMKKWLAGKCVKLHTTFCFILSTQ